MQPSATASPLILAGAGHAHLVVLRRWLDASYQPPAGTVLINPDSHAWYSGMMPGLMAGRYQVEECAIDLAPLCQALGIRLLHDSVTALDADSRTLALADGLTLSYQCLSINTGSRPPAPAQYDGSVALVPAKPFRAFHHTWQHWRDGAGPRSLGIVGGGAAAFELALALRASLPDSDIHLFSGSQLLAGQPFGLMERARDLVRSRGIHLHEETFIDTIANGQAMVGQRPVRRLDVLVLATGASAQPWYQRSGLDCDDKGFIRVNNCLQSVSHQDVFATGDCAAHTGSKKSGVYSVRHGSVLAENIKLRFADKPLRSYKPQKGALAMMATADGGALTHYAGWTLSGRMIGVWKNWLDKRFMAKHRL